MPRPGTVLRESNVRRFCSSFKLSFSTMNSLTCSKFTRHSTYLPCSEMASVMWSTLLRQSCLSITRSKRVVSTNPSIAQALRPKASRLTSSILSRRPSTALFHTSSRKAILPSGPQVIDGTANDPAPVPKPSPTHGSYHWTFERAISVGLIPLTIAPFAYGSLNPALDAAFVATILLHSHIGFT